MRIKEWLAAAGLVVAIQGVGYAQETSRLEFSMNFDNKQHKMGGAWVPGDLVYVFKFDKPKFNANGERVYRGNILQLFRLEHSSNQISEHAAEVTLVERVNVPDRLEISWPSGQVELGSIEIFNLSEKRGTYRVLSHTDTSQVGNNLDFRITSIDALPYWAKSSGSRFVRRSNSDKGDYSAENFPKSEGFKNASSAAQAAYWEGYRDALNKVDKSASKPSGDIRNFYNVGHARGWMDRLPMTQLEALQRALEDIN